MDIRRLEADVLVGSLLNTRLRSARALARLWWCVLGGFVLAAACAAQALASGVQISINGGPGPLISPTEMSENADEYFPTSPGTGPKTLLSAKALVELAGISPSDLTAQNAMIATTTVCTYNSNTGACQIATYSQVSLTEAQVVDPGTTFDINDETQKLYISGGYQEWGLDSPMPVDLEVSPSVLILGVPQPTAYPTNPALDRTVEFTEPGPISLPSGGEDTNGLQYSWDFGDGSPSSPESSSPYVSHAYAATGTYDARVTVTDAAENAGVSPQAAVVTVGPATTGQGNGNGTGGEGAGSQAGSHGSSPTGGGTAPPTALPTGPSKGSLAAHTPAVAPKPSPTSTGSGSRGGRGDSGGNGNAGGKGGGQGGGAGGKGSGAGGSSSASGHGQAGGGAAASGTLDSGAGRQRHAKPDATLGPLASAGLMGVLLESSGAPASNDASASTLGALSLLQSVARESDGSGSSAGLPAWLLGILAVVLLLVSGVVREMGTKVLSLSRAWLIGRWRTVAS
jgi:PKD domain